MGGVWVRALDARTGRWSTSKTGAAARDSPWSSATARGTRPQAQSASLARTTERSAPAIPCSPSAASAITSLPGCRDWPVERWDRVLPDEATFQRRLVTALRTPRSVGYPANLSLYEAIEEIDLWVQDERQWRNTRGHNWGSLLLDLDDAIEATGGCSPPRASRSLALGGGSECSAMLGKSGDNSPDEDLRQRLRRHTGSCEQRRAMRGHSGSRSTRWWTPHHAVITSATPRGCCRSRPHRWQGPEVGRLAALQSRPRQGLGRHRGTPSPGRGRCGQCE